MGSHSSHVRHTMRVSMGLLPSTGQAEPDLRLCPKGPTITANVTGPSAVDSTERPPERLAEIMWLPSATNVDGSQAHPAR
jgi:hypothetical protein